MKVKLPIIGQVRTGKDSLVTEVVKEVAAKEKLMDVMGGLLQFSPTTLSNYKSVSDKILKANTGWVYRNNDAIAQEVSKVEFELYTIGLSGGEIVFNEVASHPLLDLLDRPNKETSKSEFFYTAQSHKKLIGDCYILKIKTGGKVTDLRILPADKVTLKLQTPTADDPTVIKSYIYKDTIDGEQIEKTYEPEEIIPIKKPNPNNQFRGLGTVEALADTIDLDNLTTEVMKSYLKNGAIHNFALTTESKITDEQLKRLKAELKSALSGPSNAFSAPILGGGLKPVDISYSNKEQQLLDQLSWYRDKIMIGFGNTPASIGIVEDVNRANAEATIAGWLRNTVKPDMGAIVNALNIYLVPEFGENLVLGYCDPVPDDRSDDVEEVKALYPAGVMTLNEARSAVDLDEMKEGGDEFYSAPAPVNYMNPEVNNENQD